MLTTTLSPTRKADRTKLAALLVETVEAEGGTATVQDAPLGAPGDLWVRITAGPAYVTITIDREAARSGYLTPWNVEGEHQFSPAFGAAVRATVNPFHRKKCMGYARTFDLLLEDIRNALRCIAADKAFL